MPHGRAIDVSRSPPKECTMEEAIRMGAAEAVANQADVASPQRFEHVLERLLTHRGNPAAEIEALLTDDPNNVFGHCLRAAVIVCGDAVAARSSLAQSVAAIEAACPDPRHPARRHAAAAQAWLDGDSELAVERYGAIL